MSKSPFQAAETVQKRLKVLVYGDSGTGKTHFALTFPKPAVIDTEQGTDLFSGRKDIAPFHVIRTKDYKEVMAAVDWIEADGGKTYETLIIDPMTVLYQVLQEAASQSGGTSRDGGLTYRHWGIIKRMINALYTRLVNLPVHVVVTARQKADYEQKGNELLKVGDKPDADRSTEYLFDIVLRLGVANGKYLAQVVKDRSGALKGILENPSYAMLAPIARAHAKGRPVQTSDDATAAQSAVDEFAVPEDDAPRAPAKTATRRSARPPAQTGNGDGGGGETGSEWHTRTKVIAAVRKNTGMEPPHIINRLKKGEREKRIKWGNNDADVIAYATDPDSYSPPPADMPDAEPAAGDEVPFEQEGGELHKATQSELAEWFGTKDGPTEAQAKAAIEGGTPK